MSNPFILCNQPWGIRLRGSLVFVSMLCNLLIYYVIFQLKQIMCISNLLSPLIVFTKFVVHFRCT
ncbi:hypothetical protein HanRHA438_Chr09g0380341 [Helianthus annuus]|nr:hypothetical protein HanIR_Chr09g0397791 [Helianthus annuus]KAJ0886518.1 hypothetical protein HanRHA438_Chr09g0380341 [Helianthus annuus]